MKNKLEFKINNFGPIANAVMDISNINVVGGINGSGKSFVSKLLYSFLIGLSKEGRMISNISIRSLFEDFINTHEFQTNNYSSLNSRQKAKDILNKCSDFSQDWNDLNNFYREFEEICGSENLMSIKEIIDTYKKDSQYASNCINFILSSEFAQLESYIDSEINLTVDGEGFRLNFSENSYNLQLPNEVGLLFDNVIYIDSPSILDYQLTSGNMPFHYRRLFSHLAMNRSNEMYDEMYYERTNRFFNQIRECVGGEFKYDAFNKKFIFISDGETYEIRDVASGFKQLGVLQLLLSNKLLTSSSMLIIDEPEINLHPEWQVRLAEILVGMVRELEISVYINTHSPMFIEAVSVFSESNGLLDRTNFYLSCKVQSGFAFNQIYNKDMGIVYENLARPYDDIDLAKAKNAFME